MSASGHSNQYFLIVRNTRLDYKDSEKPVRAFISKRLDAFAVYGHEYLDGWDGVDARIGELVKDMPSSHIVVADIMNPLFDMNLIDERCARLDRVGAVRCICDGAVPGTEVSSVISVANIPADEGAFVLDSHPPTVVRSDMQQIHNNQINIYKYKRLKLFLALMEKVKGLHKMTVDGLMEYLSGDEGFHTIVSFAEDVRLEHHESCPHCGGGLNQLSNFMSQPIIGFVPNSKKLYSECEGCGLVVQTPFIHRDDIHMIYDEWDKNDFVVSTNNPYTTDSIRCDFEKILPILPDATRTLDLGGGIGNFSKFLSQQYPDWDVTHSDFEIKSDIGGEIRSRTLNFTRDPIGDEMYDIITAWEVIEHIPFELLSGVLSNIHKALAPGGFFIFSTPDFDSPLCKSFDFYSVCPSFHYSVFGEKWLRGYFDTSTEFDIFDTKHCSDFLDDAINWYSYGEKTCPSLALRGTSSVLKTLFEHDQDGELRKKLANSGLGTEIIVTLRKK